jgi:aminoglycoside phosphotransferase (APT) family kinase protein
MIDSATIRDVLNRFPEGQRAMAGGVDCRPVVAGAVNTVVRVVGEGADWAIRLAGAGDDVLRVSRRSEWAAHSAAADFGLAPAVIHADPDEGLLVTAWIDAPHASRALFDTPEGLLRLAQQVKTLHELPIQADLRSIDADTVVSEYLAIPRSSVTSPVSRSAVEAAVAQSKSRRRSARPVFCHNDLHQRNVLDSGRLWFIDWEYAGWGDPLFELAGIASYHDLGPDQIEALVAGYGTVTPADLRPWQRLFDAIHALWLDAANGWGTLDDARRVALVSRLSA